MSEEEILSKKYGYDIEVTGKNPNNELKTYKYRVDLVNDIKHAPSPREVLMEVIKQYSITNGNYKATSVVDGKIIDEIIKIKDIIILKAYYQRGARTIYGTYNQSFIETLSSIT
jgi:hypothetical protein